jgi:hypothetical protein
MSGASEALAAFTARVRSLAGFPALVAKEAEPLVDAAIKSTVRAGLEPDGRAWTPKKDGGRPLEHAADHIRTEARGARIDVTLTGVETFHHHGVKGGAPARPILPKAGEMPPQIFAALEQGAARAWNKLTGGAR